MSMREPELVSDDGVSENPQDMDIIEEEPGATIMWFGKHKGTRLDKLEEQDRRMLLREYREGPWDHQDLDVTMKSPFPF